MTSSKRLQDVLQKCLQDVFKTYHQVKLFLITRFQDVFEIYSKRFSDVLQRRLSIEGFALVHTFEKFMVSVENLQDCQTFLKF